jgi:hypothetical protein
MLCTFDRAAGNIAEREALGSQDLTLVETYDNRELTLEPLSANNHESEMKEAPMKYRTKKEFL